MSDAAVSKIVSELSRHSLHFTKKPLVIGGMAMEYYGIRKAGDDIDLIIHDCDYQRLAVEYPDNRKDIWGDLGIVIGSLEIWRSIMLFDYDFFIRGAVPHKDLLIMSLEKLLFSRVCAVGIKSEATKRKYETDLKLIEKHYYEKFRNPAFIAEAEPNFTAYENNNGIILGGVKHCAIFPANI